MECFTRPLGWGERVEISESYESMTSQSLDDVVSAMKNKAEDAVNIASMMSYEEIMTLLKPVNTLSGLYNIVTASNIKFAVAQTVQLLECHNLFWSLDESILYACVDVLRKLLNVIKDIPTLFATFTSGSTVLKSEPETMDSQAIDITDGGILHTVGSFLKTLGLSNDLVAGLLPIGALLSVAAVAIGIFGLGRMMDVTLLAGGLAGVVHVCAVAVRDWDSIIKSFKSTWEFLAKAIGRFVGFTYTDNKTVARQELVTKLDAFVAEIKDLEENMRLRFATVSTTPGFFKGLRAKVDSFDRLVTEILRSTENLSSFKFKIDDLRERITRLEDMYESLEASMCGKQQPTTVYIYGQPGTGKSSFMHEIETILGDLEGRVLSAYSRPSCDEYWSGYAYQDIVKYDDFYSSKKENDLVDMISIYSPNAMLLNMAALHQKGTQFKSRYVIIGSNTGYITRSGELYNPQALARRRDFVLEATSTAITPPTSHQEAMDNLVLWTRPFIFGDQPPNNNIYASTIRVVGNENGRPVHSTHTFRDLVTAIHAHQVRNQTAHRAHQDQMIARLALQAQSDFPAISEIGSKKKRSILIIGPPGCGKTVLANKFRKDPLQDDFTIPRDGVCHADRLRERVMVVYDHGGEDIVLTTNETRWNQYLSSLPSDNRDSFVRRLIIVRCSFKRYWTPFMMRSYYTAKDIEEKPDDYNKMVEWTFDDNAVSYENVCDEIREALSVETTSVIVHDCVPRMKIDEEFKSNVVSFNLRWCDAGMISLSNMKLVRSKFSYLQLSKHLMPVVRAFSKHFVPQQTLENSLRGLNALRVKLPLQLDFVVNFLDASFLLTTDDNDNAVFAIIDDSFTYRECDEGIECMKDGVVVWTATEGPICAWYRSILKVQEPSECFDITDLTPISFRINRWMKMLMRFIKTAAASASIYQLCRTSCEQAMMGEAMYDPYSNKMNLVTKKVGHKTSQFSNVSSECHQCHCKLKDSGLSSEDPSPDGTSSRASSCDRSVGRSPSPFVCVKRGTGKQFRSDLTSEDPSPDGTSSRASSCDRSVGRSPSPFVCVKRRTGKQFRSDLTSEDPSPDGTSSRASSCDRSVSRSPSPFICVKRGTGKQFRSDVIMEEEEPAEDEDNEEYFEMAPEETPLTSQADPQRYYNMVRRLIQQNTTFDDRLLRLIGLTYQKACKEDAINPRLRKVKIRPGVEMASTGHGQCFTATSPCRDFETGHIHHCPNCLHDFWHFHPHSGPFHPILVGACPFCPCEDIEGPLEDLKSKTLDSEACVDQASADLMRIVLAQNFELCANGKMIVHAQGIFQNVFITVAHAALHYSNLMLKVRSRFIPINVVSKNDERDLMIFTVPGVAVRDIRNHLQEARVGKSLEGVSATIGIRLDDFFEVRPFVLHEEKKIATNTGAHVGVLYSVSAYWHAPVQTRGGDCGSPLVIVNPSIQRKFLGVHIAANTNKAMCAPIYVSDFDNVLTSQSTIGDVTVLGFQKIVPADEESFRRENPDLSPMYKLIGRAGEVLDGEIIYHSLPKTTSTQFHKSPFHVDNCEDFVEPNVKSSLDKRLKEPFDIFAKAFNVYAHEQPVIDSELMEQVVEDVGNFIAQVCARTNLRAKVFDMDEAINGCKYLPLSNPINRQSAPGYPHMVEEGMKGRRKEAMVEMDLSTGRHKIASNVQGERLQVDVDEFLEACSEGTRTAMVFVASLKDECVKRSKVDIGKTRAFTACPAYFTLAHRMYFGAASAILANAHHELPLKIGIDASSREFADLYNYLRRSGDVGFASDFKNWDGTMPAELIAMMPRIWNKIYRECDPNWTREDDRMRENIHKHLQLPLVLYKEWLVQCPGGMMSGQPATAIENCFMNMCFYQYIWMKLARKYSPRHANSTRFRELVSFAVYGDDNLCTINPTVRVWFNAKNFAEECVKLGLSITSADKTGDLEMQPLHELTFLKRSFTMIDGYIVGALEMDTFTKMLSWTKCGKRYIYHRGDPVNFDPTTIALAVDSCLMEAALHGEEFYDDISRHFKICAQAYGITLNIIPPWRARFHEVYFRESLKMPTIPEKIRPFYGSKDRLSNMYPCQIPYENRMWHSVEQIYQYKKAAMFKDHDAMRKIVSSQDGFQAKKIGKSVLKDMDMEDKWARVKVKVMRRLLEAKFNSTLLRDHLLSTEDEYLMEANPHDVFWGIGVPAGSETISTLSYPGLNWMGKLLMELRDFLKRNDTDIKVNN